MMYSQRQLDLRAFDLLDEWCRELTDEELSKFTPEELADEYYRENDQHGFGPTYWQGGVLRGFGLPRLERAAHRLFERRGLD